VSRSWKGERNFLHLVWNGKTNHVHHVVLVGLVVTLDNYWASWLRSRALKGVELFAKHPGGRETVEAFLLFISQPTSFPETRCHSTSLSMFF
jgi:hypothetical protein